MEKSIDWFVNLYVLGAAAGGGRMKVIAPIEEEGNDLPHNTREEPYTMFSYPLDNFTLHPTDTSSSAMLKPLPDVADDTLLSPSGVSVGHK